MEGWLIRGQGGVYTAEDADGTQYVLRAKKRFRRERITPLVGDRITFSPGTVSDEHGWIDSILPRNSAFIRPAVANVTTMIIVVAPRPEPDLLLVDRLLVQCRKQGLKMILAVNKTDLDPALTDQLSSDYAGAGITVCGLSALRREGLDGLKALLTGETVCLCGQSGVGKSTLANALMNLSAQTGEISRRIQRGKNTTRHVELFRSERFHLLDTPGFSLITLSKEAMEPLTLQNFYPEFSACSGQCRFTPCWHQGEPGCKVQEAVSAGLIARDRYARYLILLRELDEAWRKRYE